MGGGVAQAATPINVAQGKLATSPNVPCSLGSLPGKAVDGKAANIYTDKWCAQGILGGATLMVDLGACYVVHEIVLRHAGAAGESPAYNTRGYSIRVGDGWSWWTIATVTDNIANSTSHPVSTGNCSRFIRLDEADAVLQRRDPSLRTRSLDLLRANRGDQREHCPAFDDCDHAHPDVQQQRRGRANRGRGRHHVLTVKGCPDTGLGVVHR
jgi:hypothetical protein